MNFSFERAEHSADRAPSTNHKDQWRDALKTGKLPGRWGLAQDIVEVWSNKPETRFGRLSQVMRTAGQLLSYWEKGRPRVQEEDPIEAFILKEGLVIPASMNGMGDMAFQYLTTSTWAREELSFGEEESTMRRFTSPRGYHVYYKIWAASTTYSWARASGDVQYSSLGPLLHAPNQGDFLAEVRTLLWDQVSPTERAIQLSTERDWTGTRYKLADMAPPGDYVSEAAAQQWADVAAMADRCQAFTSKGLSRRLIFFGPPGTGKTTLARRLARSQGSGRTLRIDAHTLGSMEGHTLAKFVAFLGPDALLTDDLDRGDADDLIHYLEKGQESKEGVPPLVIATVNDLSTLDPALLRPGRFDEVLEVSEPAPAHCQSILRHYMQRHDIPATLLPRFIKETKGFSPADIQELVGCVAVVGESILSAEAERIRIQRALYAGDSVKEFLQSRRGGRDVSDEERGHFPPTKRPKRSRKSRPSKASLPPTTTEGNPPC